MQKVMTILGTRPEIIRLSLIIPLLDKHCNHIVVNTMQNYDYKLNDLFFKDLRLRKPDISFQTKSGSFGEQMSIMFGEIEKILIEHKPDSVLILGDTNSALCAIVVERMGIPVYHMEAGNRCFDRSVPEEVNRKIIDSISSYNLPYVRGSRENLLAEGIHKSRIFTCGNPIAEVLEDYRYKVKAREGDVLNTLNLTKDNYFLATFHRAETVDIPERLLQLIEGLKEVGSTYNLPVVCSVHPRTRARLEALKVDVGKDVLLLEPFGFFDFVRLEKNAKCVLTDSGTVSEEACILHIPCVIVRDVTERPELVRCGSAMLSGVSAKSIVLCTKMMVGRRQWNPPAGYLQDGVSDNVVQFILGGGNEK